MTKTHQREGIGRKLLHELERTLKRQGYKIVLSSSEKVNKIGNIVHKKLGFMAFGQLDMIYGKEIYYKKNIT